MTNPTSSLINFGSVDATYPVAGQDNNSQGFRDNFGVIKTGLGQASTEITALQNNAAFKNAANDFGQNVLSNAQYKTFFGVTQDLGTVSTNTDISVTNGPLQVVTLGTNPTFTFKNWPSTGKYAAVRLMIYGDGNAVRVPNFSTENAGVLRYATDFPKLPGTNNYGITVGGESLAGVIVSSPSTGFTTAVGVVFSGGGLQANGTQATGTARFKVVSANVIGTSPNWGDSGNGYKLNDKIGVNSNPGIIFQVTGIDLTFTANTTTDPGNEKILSNVSGFKNIAVGVALTGAGIAPNTVIDSFDTVAKTITMNNNATAGASGISITYNDGTNTGPISGLSIVSGGDLDLPLLAGAYSTSPITGTGSGARVAMQFGIKEIVVDSVGDGYTSPPLITFNPSGGGTWNTPNYTTSITALTADNPKVIEAWTRDGGANVYMRYIGEFN